MKFEIKSRYSDAVLFSTEADSLKLAVEAAVKSGAKLSGANLSGAKLSGANLSGANLSGAKQKIVQISTLRHQVIAIDKDVSIGCHNHPLVYWLKHYRAIGKANGYNAAEIKLYGKLLAALK